MNDKTPYTSRIYIVLFISAFLVLLIGIMTYSVTSRLMDNIKSKYAPDVKIEYTRQVISDIYTLDNYVQSFLITKDTQHLRSFEFATTHIKKRIVDIQELSKGIPQWENYADSLFKLFVAKIELANKLIILKSDDETEIVMDKLDFKLKNDEELNASANTMRPFSKKAGKQKVSFDKLEDLSNQVKKESERRNKVQSYRELALYKQSFETMSALSNLLKELENIYFDKNRDDALSVSSSASSIVLTISFFSGISFLFLIILLNSIRSYARQNASYRSAILKAKDNALRLAQTKESFVSNISHEIRTPLNAIIGFTELLLTDKLTKKQREQLQIVKNSSEHLLVIVNDILDFSKIESGKLQLSQIDFNLTSLIEEVKELLQTRIAEKELSFVVDIEEAVPDFIKSDPVRLKQILLNLAGNAVKFTHQGEVKVQVMLESKRDNELVLLFNVIDSGIGIPLDKQKAIFEEFIQAEQNIARKYGGTGLGLPIVKKLVELQGGVVTLKSAPGRGSIFSFTLPVGKCHAKKQTSRKKGGQTIEINEQSVSILAADDEVYNRALLEAIFTKYNTKITLVGSGEDAVKQLLQNTFDLVLMDIRMEGMSGIEATEIIRKSQNPQIATTPIIALTAAASEKDVQACLMVGMNDYISKPFKEEELIEKINVILEKDTAENNPYKQIRNMQTRTFNPNELVKIANGNKEFVLNMLQLFVENANITAIEMKTAVSESNSKKMGNLAHKLAAPATHLGLQDLSSLLKKTERAILDNCETNEWKNLASKIEKELTLAIQSISEYKHRMENT
jgi:signal transduction histidine kinase/CheY-like chemotaxis protein/HPt (histidine-containing phosphotransfer) domain-containing protein